MAAGLAPQDSTPFASNWQNHWANRSQKQRKDDEDAQRIALGILPQKEAEKLAAIAVDASIQATRGEDTGKAMLASIEALEAFEALYRDELKDAYRAEYMAAAWEHEIKRIRRNRAVSLLLLH